MTAHAAAGSAHLKHHKIGVHAARDAHADRDARRLHHSHTSDLHALQQPAEQECSPLTQAASSAKLIGCLSCQTYNGICGSFLRSEADA